MARVKFGIFIVLLFVLIFSLWKGKTKSSPQAQRENLPAEKNERPLIIRNEGVQPNIALTPQISRSPISRTHGRSRYLLKGLEEFSIDRDKEEFILGSSLSEKAKTILLSGIALSNVGKFKKGNEVINLNSEFQAAFIQDQAAFIEGAKTLLAQPAKLPPGLSEDIVELASKMNPSPVPEINSVAIAQIQQSINSGVFTSDDGREQLLEAMMATELSATNASAGWTSIEKVIDLSDATQKSAYDAARQIIQLKLKVNSHS